MGPVRALLTIARRVLQPGGRIRLVTPDVKRGVDLYLADGDDTALPTGRPSAEATTSTIQPTFSALSSRTRAIISGTCGTRSSLSAELKAADFTEIVRHEVGQRDDPILCGLEERDTPVQLVLEAVA